MSSASSLPRSPLTESDRQRIGSGAAARFDALLDLMQCGLKTLDDKPEETPETALRALWLLAAGRPMSARLAADQAPDMLSAAQNDLLDTLVQRRLQGVPLAHITGRQSFMGVEMLAGPGALIPRRETELLGEAAAALVNEAVQSRGQALAVDVCTGSGNLALGIAAAVPQAQVFGADLSEEAVQLALRNAEHLGLSARVEFRRGDLLAPFDEGRFLGQVDVLSCNPPYISSAKVSLMAEEISRFEPELAFDGGPFGIRILNRLIAEAPRFIRPGGWLAFEVGAGQGVSVQRRLGANSRYGEIRTLTDSRGEIRALVSRVTAG
jgi:release factor glutamine methyltransferase